jgi:hypothetical protein
MTVREPNSRSIDTIAVRWPESPLVCFHGRSGTAKCTGLELSVIERQSPGAGVINLQPFTSQGKLGNCHVEVPLDSIPRFLKTLLDLYLQTRPQAPRKPSRARRQGGVR